MGTVDPYFQSYLDDDQQVIWSTRPLTLVPAEAPKEGTGAGDPTRLTTLHADGSVVVAGDRALVVIADQLTLRGVFRLTKKSGDGVAGADVTLVARELLTDGTASIDVSGTTGHTAVDKDWGASLPNAGAAGYNMTPNRNSTDVITLTQGDYDWWNRNDNHAWEGITWGAAAGDGQTSNLTGSTRNDPASPLNGQPGTDGGAGGAGGTITLRIGSLDTNAALSLVTHGGAGGAGMKGQHGATGGKGGDGAEPTDASYGHGAWDTTYRVTTPYPGGHGGRGGKGGKGGAAGRGGDAGRIRVVVRSGSADSIRGDAKAGAWGAAGDGGDAGAAGVAGFQPPSWAKDPDAIGINTWDKLVTNAIAAPAPAETGDAGDDGSKVTPQPAGGSSTVTGNVSAAVLLAGTPADTESLPLPCPLSGYLLMFLEQLRSDLLMAPYKPASEDVADRISWLTDLLAAYQPVDVAEINGLDALRGQAQTIGARVRRKLDYFGNDAAFAPLGSMNLHKQAFDTAVQVLGAIQSDYDAIIAEVANKTAHDAKVQQAHDTFAQKAVDLHKGADAESAYFVPVGHRIVGDDAQDIADARSPLDAKVADLNAAVQDACGLTPQDLFSAIGQFAFFGEGGPQQAAMVFSQAESLLDTGLTQCVGADGTHYDKALILHQVAEVSDLPTAWTEYQTHGTIGGINLNDPGGKLLLGQQSQLDELCEKLWNFPEAKALKSAFDDYVAAVQKRNADVLAYNQSVLRWQQASVSAAQATTAAAAAAAELASGASPGLASTTSQLAHMVARAKDDCVSELYLAGRAFWMWSLQPGDPLARVLSGFAMGQPLALTSTILLAASQQVYENTTTEIERRLANRSNWRPAQHQPHARGLVVTLNDTNASRFLHRLRTKKKATFSLPPARRADDARNPFDGLGDVRLWRVRPWVAGATTHNHKLRVDLTHGGRELFIDPDTNAARVAHHDPVRAVFEFDLTKPLGSPAAVVMDASLTDSGGAPVDAALIGPFTHWELDLSRYNPGLATSKITEVQLEFFCYVRPF